MSIKLGLLSIIVHRLNYSMRRNAYLYKYCEKF